VSVVGAPSDLRHDVRHLTPSRGASRRGARPAPLPTANAATSQIRRRPALTASSLSVHAQAGRARRRLGGGFIGGRGRRGCRGCSTTFQRRGARRRRAWGGGRTRALE
jgi:hypothetical protein